MGYLLNKIRAAEMARAASGELRMTKLDCPKCGEANWFEPEVVPASLEECAACGWKTGNGGFIGKSARDIFDKLPTGKEFSFSGAFKKKWEEDEQGRLKTLMGLHVGHIHNKNYSMEEHMIHAAEMDYHKKPEYNEPIEIHWTREGGMIPVSREEHRAIHAAEQATAKIIPLSEYFLKWLDRLGGAGSEPYKQKIARRGKSTKEIFKTDPREWMLVGFLDSLLWDFEHKAWKKVLIEFQNTNRLLPNNMVKI